MSIHKKNNFQPNEILLATVADKMHQMIVFIDIDQQIKYSNNSFNIFFHLNSTKIINNKLEEIVGENFFAEIKSGIDLALHGETKTFTFDYTYEYSNKYVIEINLIPVDEEGEIAGCVCMFSDVSSIINPSQAKQEDEVEHRLIIDNFRDEIWITDLELNIKYVNRYSENIYGFTPKERIKMRMDEIFVPESKTKALATLEKQMKLLYSGREPETPVTLELQAYHKNGKILDIETKADFVFDKNGNVTGIQGITRDITEKKKAATMLEQSRQNFRTLSEKLSIALDISEMAWWDFNIKTGMMTSQPNKIKEIFGDVYMTYLHVDDIAKSVHEDDQKLFIETHNNLSVGKIKEMDIEYRIFHKSGHYKWVRDRGKIVEKNDKGEPVRAIGILLDKTSEREYIDKINESEEKYRLLFENLTSSFALHKLIYDESGKAVDYTFVDVNPAFETTVGLKKEQLIGKRVTEVLPGIEPIWISVYGNVAKTQSPVKLEEYSSILDRYYEVYAYSPQIGYCATIFNDVSKRQMLQKTINENEQRLKAAEAIAHLGSWEYIVDSDELKWSEEMYRIFGFAPNDFTPTIAKLRELIHPDDRPKVKEELQKVIDTNSEFDLVLRIVRVDGSIRYVHGRGAVQKTDTYNKIIGSMLDITDVKKIQQELIVAKEKAEESDKLKSAFLANVSHEIRTPMNSIIGFLNLISDPDISEDEKQQFYTIIKNSSKHLLEIINDVIDISKIEAGEIKPVYNPIDLVTLFDEVFDENMVFANEKGLQLSYNVDPEISYIISDKKRIKQILTNLISNAIKFTENGFVKFEYKILNGNKFNIRVKDSGIGIDEKHLNIIFERFRQIENFNTKVHKGTGLGLSIVKAICELLGGTIIVNSKIGEGTEFDILIPVSIDKENNSKKSKPIQKIAQVDWSNCSVLIVEDEINNFILLEKYLKNTGIKIYFAENSIKAMRIIEVKKPDLVLLDIKLGGESGYDILKQIKHVDLNIPVIAQTAFAMQEDKQKALEHGFDGYLPKPIFQENLFIEINKFLRFK